MHDKKTEDITNPMQLISKLI